MVDLSTRLQRLRLAVFPISLVTTDHVCDIRCHGGALLTLVALKTRVAPRNNLFRSLHGREYRIKLLLVDFVLFSVRESKIL